jgi:thioredoxin-dependent peroxiredoxin
MKQLFPLLSSVLVAIGALASSAFAQDLKVGDQAPNFTLPGSDGKTYTLSQLKGHWVVLAWFPKAFTGG